MDPTHETLPPGIFPYPMSPSLYRDEKVPQETQSLQGTPSAQMPGWSPVCPKAKVFSSSLAQLETLAPHALSLILETYG